MGKITRKTEDLTKIVISALAGKVRMLEVYADQVEKELTEEREEKKKQWDSEQKKIIELSAAIDKIIELEDKLDKKTIAAKGDEHGSFEDGRGKREGAGEGAEEG